MKYYIDLKRLISEDDSQEQQVGLNTLRMRPHFIYNSLMTIYYLCDSDPKKAQQATLDFSTYLRCGFDALIADELVPFTDELEHAKAYLGVEVARVGEALSFTIDTPATNFKLPALTLQPILEKTVLHGVDPESGPLHIKLHTAELPDEFQVIIEDDGPRYEPSHEDEPVLRLDNLRKRLKNMENSRLDIGPRNNVGTIVTIHIPKSE